MFPLLIAIVAVLLGLEHVLANRFYRQSLTVASPLLASPCNLSFTPVGSYYLVAILVAVLLALLFGSARLATRFRSAAAAC